MTRDLPRAMGRAWPAAGSESRRQDRLLLTSAARGRPGKPDCSHVIEVVGGREARLKRVVVVVADGRDCVTRDEEFGFQDTTDGAVLPGLLAV